MTSDRWHDVKAPDPLSRIEGKPIGKGSTMNDYCRATTTTRAEALELVEAERDRQASLWVAPHAWGSGDCSSPNVADTVKGAVLAEECGEVSRAVLERDAEALRTELVQVAAVAVAWLEGLPA